MNCKHLYLFTLVIIFIHNILFSTATANSVNPIVTIDECKEESLAKNDYGYFYQDANGDCILVLFSDTFWNTNPAKQTFWDIHNIPESVINHYKNSFQDMPKEDDDDNRFDLRQIIGEQAKYNDERAEQLQWAIHATNALASKITNTVKLIVTYGDYDFSSLNYAHRDADGIHTDFLPKLFISRDNFILEGEKKDNLLPNLYYKGPGHNGLNSGRVLLMIESGKTEVEIKNLKFEGDNAWLQNVDGNYCSTKNYIPVLLPELILHENNEFLNKDADRRLWHGMIMVGLTGGDNGVTIDNVIIEKAARAGIAIVGGATITNSTIAGVVPQAQNDCIINHLLETETSIAVTLGKSAIGMNFHTGISHGFGGSLTIQENTIVNFVEGINGKGAFWDIYNNKIKMIGDHAIYILGKIETGSSIKENTIEKVLEAAIKIGGNICVEKPEEEYNECGNINDPLSSERTGAYKTTIQANTFKLIKKSALRLSGTLNTISENTLIPYSSDDDTTNGDFYNPNCNLVTNINPESHAGCNVTSNQANIYPDFYFTTDGGNDNYTNHFAFNKIINNKKFNQETNVKENLSIMIHQSAHRRDMSIAMNKITGPDQDVYFYARKDTQFSPLISVSDANLIIGPKLNCADCIGYTEDYRTSINPIWTKFVNVKNLNNKKIPHILIKFDKQHDTFLLSEHGTNGRIHDSGVELTIREVADIDGDGIDELYFHKDNDLQKLYGMKLYSLFDIDGNETNNIENRIISGTSWDYNASSFGDLLQVKAVTLNQNKGKQLISAWSNDSATLRESITSNIQPTILGEGIYSNNNNLVRLLQTADLSVAGERDLSTEEMYIAYESGKIVGLYWDHNHSSWLEQDVYTGNQKISLMKPARLRAGETKQRMYQRFEGKTIYESNLAGSLSLPSFGLGNLFYNGSATCDMLIAADLNKDGLQEMASHYIQAPNTIYYGIEESGLLNANAGHIYNGSYEPKLMEFYVRYNDDSSEEKIITIFDNLSTIYLSKYSETEEININGYNYIDYVLNIVFANQ